MDNTHVGKKTKNRICNRATWKKEGSSRQSQPKMFIVIVVLIVVADIFSSRSVKAFTDVKQY